MDWMPRILRAAIGNETRGHRFLAPATFEGKSPDVYVEELKKRHVLGDSQERTRTMMERAAQNPNFLTAIVAASGGKMVPNPGGILIRDGGGKVPAGMLD